jgi:lysophospholipase L1-like esterase
MKMTLPACWRIAVCILPGLILAAQASKTDTRPVTIFSIGDSTMADKPTDTGNPEWGWCQALKERIGSNVRFENHAVNGRSTRSFLTEGRWSTILELLQPGDWVLIQFGHNDQKEKSPERYTNPYTAYRMNLQRFVEDSRTRGAHPVLMSSIVRRHFNEQGTLIDTHGAYPFVARQLALELDVPFVDMQWLSESHIEALGPDASRELFLVFAPGEHPFFPDGKTDNTHLSAAGARTLADLFLEDIRKQNLAIANLFNP